MGLDSFKTEHGVRYDKRKATEGGEVTINTEQKAVTAIKDVKSDIDEWPTVEQFNDNRVSCGWSTRAEHFTRNAGIEFSEARNLAGGHGYMLDVSEDMKKASPEKAYIIGVILGDGWVSSTESNSTYVVGLTAKDKEFCIEFGRQLCLWANLVWDGWDSEETDVSTSYVNRDNPRSDQFRVCKYSKNLYQEFSKYQGSNWEANGLASELYEYKSELLRGLWDSEGSIRDDRRKTVRFSNSDDRINLLYMQLVRDVVGVELDMDWEWVTDDRASRHYGEFRVTKRSTVGYDTKARSISIPKKYNYDFFTSVQPTIYRKRELFLS